MLAYARPSNQARPQGRHPPWEECDRAWMAIKAQVLCVFLAMGAKMSRAVADGTLDFGAAPGRARRRLEENAAAALLNISADIAEALLQVFSPGATSGPRYPENHLKRLGI